MARALCKPGFYEYLGTRGPRYLRGSLQQQSLFNSQPEAKSNQVIKYFPSEVGVSLQSICAWAFIMAIVVYVYRTYVLHTSGLGVRGPRFV